MKAKFELKAVTKQGDAAEELKFSAVTEKAFNDEGKSDDNDFSKWTPSGELTMTVTNPDLIGKFQVGEKFYLEFTKAE